MARTARRPLGPPFALALPAAGAHRRAARRAACALALVLAAGALAAPVRAQGMGAAGGGGGPSVDDILNQETSAVKSRLPGAQPAAPPPPPPFKVDVLAVPFPIAGAIDDQVALLVEVRGKELLVNNEGDLQGEIEASAVSAAGATADHFTQPFVLDPTDERIASAGLKLYGVLRLPPGEYKVRVAVRNATTKGHGEREVPLHAPDFARHEAVLSPPLFPDPAEHWRVFQQSDSPHDLPFPFVDAQGGGFLPAAAPGVAPEGGSFVVYAYGGAGDAPRLSARLVSGSKTASAPKLTLLESGAGKFTIQRRLLARIDGPLPEGAHRLEVVVTSPDAARTTSTPLVVAAQAAPQAQIATSGEEDPLQQAVVDEPPALAAGWTREDLAARYRALLASAAAGELDGTVQRLAELEIAATPKHGVGELKALRQVELQVIEADRTDLLAVAFLHARVDDELRARQVTWLLAQNRVWLAELMERWVKSGGDASARHVAAQLLAAVGSSKEALEYEPGNELALLRLAISAEKTGLLKEAEAALQKLIQAHPESAPARLRLAVVHRRAGDVARAATELAAIFGDAKAPKWVASLACQQLAEIERARGNEERAEALLRQGLDRLGTQALYLQLAFYLDERQRPDEAVQVLNGMPVAGGPDEMSGRFLYNEPPRAEIARARQQVEARVLTEWPQLRASLAGGAGARGSRR